MLTNTDKYRIEIPLSKSKLILLIFIALVFVIVGFLFVINPSAFANSGIHHRYQIEILILGYACIIFFGAGVIVFIFKLFDNKPGLLIDDEGITINPRPSAPIIKWKNIEKFEIKVISGTSLIQIYLKNPEEFINRLNNNFKRKLAAFSLERYGTPVGISTSGLKINTDELYELLTSKLKVQHRAKL